MATENDSRAQVIILRVPNLVDTCMLVVERLSTDVQHQSKHPTYTRGFDPTLALTAIYALAGLLIGKFFEGIAQELGKNFAGRLIKRINQINGNSRPSDINKILASVQLAITKVELDLSVENMEQVQQARALCIEGINDQLVKVGFSTEDAEKLKTQLNQVLVFDTSIKGKHGTDTLE